MVSMSESVLVIASSMAGILKINALLVTLWWCYLTLLNNGELGGTQKQTLQQRPTFSTKWYGLIPRRWHG